MRLRTPNMILRKDRKCMHGLSDATRLGYPEIHAFTTNIGEHKHDIHNKENTNMANQNAVEYKILVSDDLANEKNLNEQGVEGWLLITIIKDNNKYYYYFRR